MQPIGVVSWRDPGIGCYWTCSANHFKWKRDVSFEVCVACPVESLDQESVAMLQGAASSSQGTGKNVIDLLLLP